MTRPTEKQMAEALAAMLAEFVPNELPVRTMGQQSAASLARSALSAYRSAQQAGADGCGECHLGGWCSRRDCKNIQQAEAGRQALSVQDDEVHVTQEDVDAARAMIHECAATDFISGKCKNKADRNWVYRKLLDAATRLVGTVPAAPARLAGAAQGEAGMVPVKCPMDDFQVQKLYTAWRDKPGTSFADLIRSVERAHGIGVPTASTAAAIR